MNVEPLVLRRQLLSLSLCLLSPTRKKHVTQLLSKVQELDYKTNTSRYWAHKNKYLINIEPSTYQSSRLYLLNCRYSSFQINLEDEYNIGIQKNDSNQNAEFNSIVSSKWEHWLYIFTDLSKHSDVVRDVIVT